MRKDERMTLKKINLHLQDRIIDEEGENDADDEGGEGASPKNKLKLSDKEEEKDQVAELKDQDANVIHKKRRRKNVDSKDAQT